MISDHNTSARPTAFSLPGKVDLCHLGSLGPKALVGDIPALLGGVQPASVVAKTPLKVLQCRADRFAAHLDHNIRAKIGNRTLPPTTAGNRNICYFSSLSFRTTIALTTYSITYCCTVVYIDMCTCIYLKWYIRSFFLRSLDFSPDHNERAGASSTIAGPVGFNCDNYPIKIKSNQINQNFPDTRDPHIFVHAQSKGTAPFTLEYFHTLSSACSPQIGTTQCTCKPRRRGGQGCKSGEQKSNVSCRLQELRS